MLCSPTKKSIFLEKFIEPGTGFFFHWHLRMRVIQFMSHRTTTIFFHNILHVTGQTLFVDCIVLWLTLRLWIRHNATGSLQHLDWRSSICYRSKETRRHCGLVESGGRTTGKNQASNTTQFISSQFHKSFKFNFMSNRCAELPWVLQSLSRRASLEGSKVHVRLTELGFSPFFFCPFFFDQFACINDWETYQEKNSLTKKQPNGRIFYLNYRANDTERVQCCLKY